MRKRVVKKVIKRVSEDQKKGVTSPLFYLSALRVYMQKWYSRRYVTVIGPGWWDREDRGTCAATSFAEYVEKEWGRAEEELSKLTGVDERKMVEDYKGARRKQNRKPRKKKPLPPVRRMRNPQTFWLTIHDGEGSYKQEPVIGETAFKYRDYTFFIHPIETPWGTSWSVSEESCGLRVSRRYSYKMAIKEARQRVEANYDILSRQVNNVIERMGEKEVVRGDENGRYVIQDIVSGSYLCHDGSTSNDHPYDDVTSVEKATVWSSFDHVVYVLWWYVDMYRKFRIINLDTQRAWVKSDRIMKVEMEIIDAP